MSAVRTFKALDYDMRLYGFWPSDLALVCVLFILLHSVFNSLILDTIVVSPSLYVAWRARKRPPRYAASLFSFCATPSRHSVGVYPESNPKPSRGAGPK